MAYACPVCDVVAPDGEHLAHHLAVVASTRGGDHERWLDEHEPEWSECTPAELAAVATAAAEAVDHDLADAAAEHGHLEPGRPDVDVPGTGNSPRTGDGGSSRTAAGAGADGVPGSGPGRTAGVSDDAAAVLEEARRLTEQSVRDVQEGERTDEAPATEPDEGQKETDESERGEH